MAPSAWARNSFPILTLALLLAVTIAAWAGVVIDSTTMAMGGQADGTEMSAMGTEIPVAAEPHITTAGLASYIVAWMVMMAAMMLPSAAPMILLYRTVASGRAARGDLFVPTWVFVAGYLAVWAVFGGVVYTAGQLVGLVMAGDTWLAARAPYGVAFVLLAAGAYQFTPLKRRCLNACQSPLRFLMEHWKPNRRGAFQMGLEHGSYCAACCWGLMTVLVVAGAMGLRWVLVIALVVAAEKLLPHGQWAARMAGVVLLGLGIAIAVHPQLALALHG